MNNNKRAVTSNQHIYISEFNPQSKALTNQLELTEPSGSKWLNRLLCVSSDQSISGKLRKIWQELDNQEEKDTSTNTNNNNNNNDNDVSRAINQIIQKNQKMFNQ